MFSPKRRREMLQGAHPATGGLWVVIRDKRESVTHILRPGRALTLIGTHMFVDLPGWDNGDFPEM